MASTTTGMSLLKHPLQRLTSPSRGISALVHLIGIVSFASSFKYNESFGWHFQYLTILGLSLATLTFIVGIAADLTQSIRLFYVKNVLSICSAPLEVLISILYWGLRAIDKRLVIPEFVELDPLADFGFHAMPAILLSVDLLLLSPPWTITTFPALGLSGFLAFSYWWWVEYCHAKNGWYPYPLFEKLTPPYRAMVFATSAILMTLSTAGLKWAYEIVNGNVEVELGPRAERERHDMSAYSSAPKPSEKEKEK